MEFISGKKLIIHNAPFDIGFINHELKKINMKILDTEKNIVDTLSVARSKYPGSSNSLDNLCKKFSIDLSRRTKHNALLDCELLRKVYINLIDEKEPALAFKDSIENIPITGKKEKKKYFKNIIKLTEKEIESHDKFLKKELKKNFF